MTRYLSQLGLFLVVLIIVNVFERLAGPVLGFDPQFITIPACFIFGWHSGAIVDWLQRRQGAA
jgi:hypothetical protein